MAFMKPIERVKKIIEYKGLSISAFERMTNMSNNSIQTAIKRNSNLKDDTLNSILRCFPDISPEWLLTGNGEMLRAATDVVDEAKISYTSELDKQYIIDLQKEYIAKLKEEIKELKG